MSSKFISFLLLSVVFIVFTSEMLSDNGKAGYTGSPGENKCNNCHSSYALNSGGGSVVLTSDMVNWQYEPGYTYNVTATVSRTGNSLFGIGLEALTTANGNAGTLASADYHTQIKTKTVSSVVRNNIVHTLNGGANANSMSFTFHWTAPSTNIGNVTMYYCGVAANNNGNENLDYVYNGSQLITPMTGASTSELVEQQLFSVYPNPATDVLNIASEHTGSSPLMYKVFDLSGKQVQELTLTGKSEYQLNVSSYAKGIYYLSAENGKQKSSRKIVIQ